MGPLHLCDIHPLMTGSLRCWRDAICRIHEDDLQLLEEL
jgi:hypothetical protein